MKTLTLTPPKTEAEIDRYVYCQSVCPHRMEICWQCDQFDDTDWRQELRRWKNTKKRKRE